MWPPVIVPMPTLPRPDTVIEEVGKGAVMAAGGEGFGESGLAMKKLIIAQTSVPIAARALTIYVQRGGPPRRPSRFTLFFRVI